MSSSVLEKLRNDSDYYESMEINIYLTQIYMPYLKTKRV